MKVNRRSCWMVLVLTAVTSTIPTQALLSQDPVGRTTPLQSEPVSAKIHDVELTAGVGLVGQVIDATGHPVAGQTILVQQSDRAPMRASTDQEGRFRVNNIAPGICRIQCAAALVVCRCWSPNTAPPAATRELLLSPGETIERGQRPIAELLSGPVLIGLIIAAAVAIPIAIHNSQDDAS